MKKLILVVFTSLGFVLSQAQELNCRVTVIAPQVAITDQSIFETMEESIANFMNGRKWTNDTFEFDERIECNMQITISEASTSSSFSGSIQVQSSRPVYNSDYKTALLSVNDQDFDIDFLQNTMIQFSIDQHRDNLSSILAFYAYLIIGMDYDSFAEEGGTEFLLKAQTIVANAQNTAVSGWKASEGNQNRYWLVENLLSQTFKPFRKCVYRYHRHGFDKMYNDVEGARAEIAEALIGLRNTNKIKPGNYNFQTFFYAKADEIVNLFKPAPQEEKLRVYNVLKQIDPGNIPKYEKMMK
ncbi:MAG: DUF4835 family protein [Flavobacteriales bacterium]|nr:DUF4835 family protein [Flavobacteriales bacterium]